MLTFGSRVKTTLNHHQFYHIISYCTEKCVVIKDTPALFAHCLCCCGRILLLCSSWNLCCSTPAPLICSCEGICRANRCSVSYPGLQATDNSEPRHSHWNPTPSRSDEPLNGYNCLALPSLQCEASKPDWESRQPPTIWDALDYLTEEELSKWWITD